MPFVAGESLRQRLDREGPLPIPEVVRLLREVADALGFAHRRGIIHRDLKPANILLSEGHALVADFGIAKALVVASNTLGGDSDESSITSTGLVLGTPAYMAPEQAAGDQTANHRADLYALGCLGYELLTGQPPFHASSVRGMLTAHMIEPPTPVTQHRPEVPTALTELIQQLLAKDPAERPQTAHEVLSQLETGALERLPARPRPRLGAALRAGPRSRVLAGGLLAVTALGLATAGYLVLHASGVGAGPSLLAGGVLKQHDRMVLADFDNHTRDSLLGTALTDAFRIDFSQSSVVSLVPANQIADALARMKQPATAGLAPALAREVALRDGIKAVITGAIAAVGSGYLLSVQVITPDSGTVLAAYRETAKDATEAIPAIDRLSRRVRARVGESIKSLRASHRSSGVTTASIPALRELTAVRYGRPITRGNRTRPSRCSSKPLRSTRVRDGLPHHGLLCGERGTDGSRHRGILRRDLTSWLPPHRAERHFTLGDYYLIADLGCCQGRSGL